MLQEIESNIEPDSEHEMRRQKAERQKGVPPKWDSSESSEHAVFPFSPTKKLTPQIAVDEYMSFNIN